MPEKVDLTKKPYNLTNKQISLVKNLVLNMSLDDKLKQLFIHLTASKDEEYLKEEILKTGCGGVRYNPGTFKDIYNHNYNVQKYAKIPCFIAANCESGGNGAFIGGTYIGNETKIGATKNIDYAYQLGYISAKQASLAGINTIFAPICDVCDNFRNPVVSLRTFGNDPIQVKNMSLAMLKGIHDGGLLSAAKHFPGDGFNENDQHLCMVSNNLSTKDWDYNFGNTYKALINEGLDMVMVGHIKLPSYEKFYNPNIKDQDIKPATLSKTIITDLLKTQLGFNGLAITDATHMVGLTSADKRSNIIPNIIASGCDMILFYNDFEEDFKYIKDGYEKGIITDERLNDALYRILGLKAKLNILNKNVNEYFPKYDESLLDFKNDIKVSQAIAKDAITLVKDTQNIIPINNKTHKRILIVPQHDENPFGFLFNQAKKTIYDTIKELLEQKGFEVTIFESLMDKAKRLPKQEAMKIVMNVYNNKTPIKDLTNNYDLVIQFAHFDPHNTTQRISWKLSKGTPDIPWYVYELPTIFVSTCSPFHLLDVPMVKTYINCYDENKITIESLIAKLVGEEKFKGISPVDAFCKSNEGKY